MPDSLLTPAERALLEALNDLSVRYLVVGMSAALLQGARGATEDIDLWFERINDPRLDLAARRAGGFWMTGFRMRPPGFAGEALGDRFDVVTHMHGLGSFAEEYAQATPMAVDDIVMHVLPLDRIIASKRATARPKDLAQLPALEEAQTVARESTLHRDNGSR